MQVKIKPAFLIVPVIAFASLFVIACSDDDNGDSTPAASPTRAAAAASPTSAPAAASPTSAPAAASPTSAPAGGGASLTVQTPSISYSPNTLTARAGQAVSIAYTNSDDLPHSFTITGVVDSGVISAGGSTNLSFTPAQAGTLTYFCTVHGQAAMSGTLTVQAAGSSLPPAGGGQTTSGSAAPPAAPPASTADSDYGY